VRVVTQAGEPLHVRARIRGRVESGRVRVESIGPETFRWMWQEGAAVTDLVFASVEEVEVAGLPDDAVWEITGLDLGREDLTLLLPLWAGMVEPEEAISLLRDVLLDPQRFFRPFGLASVSHGDAEYDAVAADPRGAVHPALNLLLGEALVRYGLRTEASELMHRMLDVAVESLRRDHGFWSAVHPESGAGLGRRLDLRGVPPLSLFLDILGIGLRSPDCVRLEGRSPLEYPVIVRWRGITVDRSKSETRVQFPDGGTAVVKDEAPVLVERVVEGGDAAPEAARAAP
jgi:hypothetical protein